MSTSAKYILSIDQGTTSSRAILFDHSGKVKGVAQREYRQIFPRPGYVEHDANEIWGSQLGVAREVLDDNDIKAENVAAIGITNQRETTILWDRKTGEPVHNAIVWQDRRTAEYCAELKEKGLEEEVQKRTGLLIDPYFSGTKVKWILDNVEGVRERAKAGDIAFGTVDSWLIWNLTGGKVHATDVTNASRTLLFNIGSLEWDRDQLKLFGIPEEVLPDVVSSSGKIADVEESLFGHAIPIAGVAGDQHASLFGQICTSKGQAKNTYGTGCFMLMNTGAEPVISKNRLLTTIAWQLGDVTTYALEGSVFIGGAVVQWLRDGLGLIERSKDVEELAGEVETSDGVYFVPAFTGLGAPHWDPFARGLIYGLTRGSTAAHIARAALEGIAFQVADVLGAMERDTGYPVEELRVDGGAAANEMLMQFQADVLGVPVVRPEHVETTALGAAYFAGLGIGFWEDVDDVAQHWHADARFERSMSEETVQQLVEGWLDALERAR